MFSLLDFIVLLGSCFRVTGTQNTHTKPQKIKIYLIFGWITVDSKETNTFELESTQYWCILHRTINHRSLDNCQRVLWREITVSSLIYIFYIYLLFHSKSLNYIFYSARKITTTTKTAIVINTSLMSDK